jgi:hypothetical protein
MPATIQTKTAVAPTDSDVVIYVKTDQTDTGDIVWGASVGTWASPTTPIVNGYSFNTINVDEGDAGPNTISAKVGETGTPSSQTIEFVPYDDDVFGPMSQNHHVVEITGGTVNWNDPDTAINIRVRMDYDGTSTGNMEGTEVDWQLSPLSSAFTVYDGKGLQLYPVDKTQGSPDLVYNTFMQTFVDANGIAEIWVQSIQSKMLLANATTPGVTDPQPGEAYFVSLTDSQSPLGPMTMPLDKNKDLNIGELPTPFYTMKAPIVPSGHLDDTAWVWIKGNDDYIGGSWDKASQISNQKIDFPVAQLKQDDPPPTSNNVRLFLQDNNGGMWGSSPFPFGTIGSKPNQPDPDNDPFRVFNAPTLDPDIATTAYIDDLYLDIKGGIKLLSPALDPTYVQVGASMQFNFYLNGYSGETTLLKTGFYPPQPDLIAVAPGDPAGKYTRTCPSRICSGYGPPPAGYPPQYFYPEIVVYNPDGSTYYSWYAASTHVMAT